jgi:hypothetical protein
VKNKTAILISLCLLISVLAVPALAQSEPQSQQSQKQPQPKPELFAFWEIVVEPGDASAFEAALRKEIALSPPYPWGAYSTMDFHYYFPTPIENFAGIDNLNKMDEQWMAKMGEKYKEVEKSFAETYQYYRFGVMSLRPDLSYTPPGPALKPEESKFIYLYFWYVEPGKEKEFETNLSKLNDVWAKAGVPFPGYTYQVVMGTEMPLYIGVCVWKSEVDFYASMEKAMGKQKQMPGFRELVSNAYACLRKTEIKTGWPRPDLSCLPETK